MHSSTKKLIYSSGDWCAPNASDRPQPQAAHTHTRAHPCMHAHTHAHTQNNPTLNCMSLMKSIFHTLPHHHCTPPHPFSTLRTAFTFLTSLKCSWLCQRLSVCNQWRAPRSLHLQRSCLGKFGPTIASSEAVEENTKVLLPLKSNFQ